MTENLTLALTVEPFRPGVFASPSYHFYLEDFAVFQLVVSGPAWTFQTKTPCCKAFLKLIGDVLVCEACSQENQAGELVLWTFYQNRTFESAFAPWLERGLAISPLEATLLALELSFSVETLADRVNEHLENYPKRLSKQEEIAYYEKFAQEACCTLALPPVKS